MAHPASSVALLLAVSFGSALHAAEAPTAAPALIAVRAAQTAPATAPATQPARASYADPKAAFIAWNSAVRNLDADTVEAAFYATTPAEKQLVTSTVGVLRAEKHLRDAVTAAFKPPADKPYPALMAHAAPDDAVNAAIITIEGDAARIVSAGGPPLHFVRINGSWRMDHVLDMVDGLPNSTTADKGAWARQVCRLLDGLSKAVNDIARDTEQHKFDTADDVWETARVEIDAVSHELAPTPSPPAGRP